MSRGGSSVLAMRAALSGGITTVNAWQRPRRQLQRTFVPWRSQRACAESRGAGSGGGGGALSPITS